jgi:hypothetical protein
MKSIGSGQPNSASGGGSGNDLMLLRSRMEYVEKESASLKKMYTDLKK